jgi:uncharacterized protein YbaR (Trm112 family)
MKTSLLAILACPECKGALQLHCDKCNGDFCVCDEIDRGNLLCTKCNERYPIEDGIPNMLPRKLRLK